MSARNHYQHINPEDICELYYANTGDYNWRTQKGKPKDWKYSLNQIRAHLGFGNVNNILDRIKGYSACPGKRTAIPGSNDKRTRSHNREQIPGTMASTNGDSGEQVEIRVARTALTAQVIVMALNAPRVADTVYEVAIGLSRTMGYPSAPSKTEVLSVLSKMVGKL